MKKHISSAVIIYFVVSITLSSCTWFGNKVEQPTPATVGVMSGLIDDVNTVVVVNDNETSSWTELSSPTDNLTQNELTIVRSWDVEKCNVLIDVKKTDCIDAISYNKAIDLLKYEECETIVNETSKKECVDKVSKALYDSVGTVADCKKIRDASLELMCVKRFTSAADIKNGLASCISITDKKLSTQCLDEYYLQQVRSKQTNDLGICDKITNILWKRECRILINQNNVTSVVNNSTIGETAKVVCSGNAYCMKQKIVAEWSKTGSITSCSAITDANMRKVCADEINAIAMKSFFNDALAKKDPNLCDKITDDNMVKRCKEIVIK